MMTRIMTRRQKVKSVIDSIVGCLAVILGFASIVIFALWIHLKANEVRNSGNRSYENITITVDDGVSTYTFEGNVEINYKSQNEIESIQITYDK